MKVKKPHLEELELNLTPMIDCLLFLVAFLLLSTTFNKYSRLNLMLPEATGVPEAKKLKKIEVFISKEGLYTIDGNAIAKAEETELQTILKEAITIKGKDVSLIIAADGQASHQSVVTIMDAAGKVGLANINISTKRSSSKP